MFSKMEVILVLIAVLGVANAEDTTITRGWTPTAGKKDELIDYNIKATPIQVKTDSEAGSQDRLWVRFLNEAGTNGAGVSVFFTDPLTYEVGYCTDTNNRPEVGNLPLVGDERIWTIAKTETSVSLHCNGNEIVNHDFTASAGTCLSQWSIEMTKMTVHKDDTASDAFRAKGSCFPEFIAGGYKVSLDDDDENGNERATYMCYHTFSMTPNKDMMAQKINGGLKPAKAYKALYGMGICDVNDIRYLPECLDHKEAGHCGLPTEIENGNALEFMLNEEEGDGDMGENGDMGEDESDATMPIRATYECKAGYKMYNTIHGNIGFCREDGSMEIPSCEKNDDYMNVKYKLQNGRMKKLQRPDGKVFGGIVLSMGVDHEENDVGSWEYTCNDGINDNAAGAVCRSLGFKSGIIIPASKKMMMDKHEFGWTRVSCKYDDTLVMSHNCEAMPYEEAVKQSLKEAACFKGLDIAAAMCFDDKWKFDIELKLYGKKMACLAQFRKQGTRINLKEMGTVKAKFLLDGNEIETGDVKYKPKKGFFARVDVKDKEFNCASCEIYVGDIRLDSAKSCKEE